MMTDGVAGTGEEGGDGGDGAHSKGLSSSRGEKLAKTIRGVAVVNKTRLKMQYASEEQKQNNRMSTEDLPAVLINTLNEVLTS